jgi:hypothetical protein
VVSWWTSTCSSGSMRKPTLRALESTVRRT